MFRRLGVAVLVLSLSGCAASGSPQWWRSLAGVSPAPGRFHFNWQIEGDPSLAPLQVFDDGRRTWLQYPAGQLVPAVFERTATGDRLLHPQREGDYLVLSGVLPSLVVRGGHLQAQIRRDAAVGQGAPGSQDSPDGAVSSGIGNGVDGAESAPISTAPVPDAPDVVPIQASAASVRALAPPVSAAPSTEPAGRVRADASPTHAVPPVPPPLPPAPPRLPPPAPPPHMASPATPTVATPVRASLSARPPAPRLFEATPADGNIRRALGRWARSAGWVFDAEHWAVDVDIPLAGSAAFGEEFVPAVRELLAATELGDRPLQPCFYANRVLRVVPLVQRCDRTQVAGASS